MFIMCRDQYWPNQDLEEIFICSICCHSSLNSFFPGGILHLTTLCAWVEIQNQRWNVLLLEAGITTLLEDIGAKVEGPYINRLEDANQNGKIDRDSFDRIYGCSETWEETSFYLNYSDIDAFEDNDENNGECISLAILYLRTLQERKHRIHNRKSK